MASFKNVDTPVVAPELLQYRCDNPVIKRGQFFIGNAFRCGMSDIFPSTAIENDAERVLPFTDRVDPAHFGIYDAKHTMFDAFINAINFRALAEHCPQFYDHINWRIALSWGGLCEEIQAYNESTGEYEIISQTFDLDSKHPVPSDFSKFHWTDESGDVTAPYYIKRAADSMGSVTSYDSYTRTSYDYYYNVDVKDTYVNYSVTLNYFAGSYSRVTNIARNRALCEQLTAQGYTHLRFRHIPSVYIELRKNVWQSEPVGIPLYYGEDGILVRVPRVRVAIHPTQEITTYSGFTASGDTGDFDEYTFVSIAGFAEDTPLSSADVSNIDVADNGITLTFNRTLSGLGSNTDIWNDIGIDTTVPVPMLLGYAQRLVQSFPASFFFADTYWNRTYTVIEDGIAVDVQLADGGLTIKYKMAAQDYYDYPTAEYSGTCDSSAEIMFLNGMELYNYADEGDDPEYCVKSSYSGTIPVSDFTSELWRLTTKVLYDRKTLPGNPSDYALTIQGARKNSDGTYTIAPDTLTGTTPLTVIATMNDYKYKVEPHITIDGHGVVTAQDPESGYNRSESVDCTVKKITDWNDVEYIDITLWVRTLGGWNSISPKATARIFLVHNKYTNIAVSSQAVYLDGAHPTREVILNTTPATLATDSVVVGTTDETVASVELDGSVITITQEGSGKCNVIARSYYNNAVLASISVVSGSTAQGGQDTEPDTYTSYPTPTTGTQEDDERAQHAYYSPIDWRTSQLGVHTAGFDHGIGRGTTYDASPGQLYAVFSERTNGAFFRDAVKVEGVSDIIDAYVPQVLLQGDDKWHTDCDAYAYMDTGSFGDRTTYDNKRYREVQYILQLDDDCDLDIAFAFSVDGAVRKPLTKPVVSFDPVNNILTVDTEYDEPYEVGHPGKLNDWHLDKHTLANAQRVRVRQNVTGKGITASTQIVFKTSGHWKLLGVNYVYRPMYSR